jgi:hypothetical protein
MGSDTHTSTHMTDTNGLRHTRTHLHSRVHIDTYADTQRHQYTNVQKDTQMDRFILTHTTHRQRVVWTQTMQRQTLVWTQTT